MNDPQGKLAQLIEERKGWERLTSTPEWINLVQTLQQQADDLQNVVINTPLRKLDDALEQEYRKGQLYGMLSISNTAQTIMSELDFEIQRVKENIDAGPEQSSGQFAP